MASVRSFGRIRARTPSLVESTDSVAADFASRGRRCTIEVLASGSSDDYAEWIIVRIHARKAIDADRCLEVLTAALTRRGAALLPA